MPNSNLYRQPTEEVTDKTSLEAAYTMQLCIEEKFKRSFSQIKMLFSNHTFYCAWFLCFHNNAMLGLSEWQKRP